MYYDFVSADFSRTNAIRFFQRDRPQNDNSPGSRRRSWVLTAISDDGELSDSFSYDYHRILFAVIETATHRIDRANIGRDKRSVRIDARQRRFDKDISSFGGSLLHPRILEHAIVVCNHVSKEIH